MVFVTVLEIRWVAETTNQMALLGLAEQRRSALVVGVVNPTNYVSSTVNAGDPDTEVDDNDDNGSLHSVESLIVQRLRWPLAENLRPKRHPIIRPMRLLTTVVI